MQGRTHKVAGCCAMIGAYLYMWRHNLLLDSIHPIVQLAVMYPVASWGSTMPDLDQSCVDTIPDKTPFSIAVYKLLHIGKIKHRSWQTHCLLLTLLFFGVLGGLLYFATTAAWLGTGTATYDILLLMYVGFGVGVLSHLFMDLLTFEGIQLVPGVWLHPLHAAAFKTGTTYERAVRVFLYILVCIEVVLFVAMQAQLI